MLWTNLLVYVWYSTLQEKRTLITNDLRSKLRLTLTSIQTIVSLRKEAYLLKLALKDMSVFLAILKQLGVI